MIFMMRTKPKTGNESDLTPRNFLAEAAFDRNGLSLSRARFASNGSAGPKEPD
jgi:hypothetical protein